MASVFEPEIDPEPALSEEPPIQVLISRAEADSAVASRFAAFLRNKGYEVVAERDLGAVNSLAARAAREAPVVICLVSRAALTSKWVKEQAALAARRHVLLEVLLEPVDALIDAPGAREPFDMTGWSGAPDDSPGWRSLYSTVQAMAGPPGQRPVSHVPEHVARTIGVGIAAVLVFVFAGRTSNLAQEAGQQAAGAALPEVARVAAAPEDGGMGGPRIAREPESAGAPIVVRAGPIAEQPQVEALSATVEQEVAEPAPVRARLASETLIPASTTVTAVYDVSLATASQSEAQDEALLLPQP